MKQKNISEDSELYQWLSTLRRNSGVLLLLDPPLSRFLSYYSSSKLGFLPSSDVYTANSTSLNLIRMAIIPPSCITSDYTEFSADDPKRIQSLLKRRLNMSPSLIVIHMYDFLVGICEVDVQFQRNGSFFTFMLEAEDLECIDATPANKLLRFCQRLEGWI